VRRNLTYAEAVEQYLRGSTAPRYMRRLRELENEYQALCRQLELLYVDLVEEVGHDLDRFAAAWREKLRAWSFDRVNSLVRAHNAWYPMETDLPMDPRTRDYVRIRGQSYRRRELGPRWVLEYFPPDPRVRAPTLPARVPRSER
jgi:hypothetical protein